MLLPLLAVLQVASGPANGSVTPPTNVYQGVLNQLDVTPPRVEAEIVVDGLLQEDVWSSAAVLSGFSQYQPADGLPADDRTEVLVWYSSDAIHFGIRAFEPHGEVNATLADRDNIQNDDHLQLLIDPFDDGRRALVFGVNPLGIQADGMRVERGVQRTSATRSATSPVDLSPDYLFDSRGRLTDYGYEIEIRIPFKSLSFQPQETQDWGINVIRRVQHSGRDQTWTPALQSRASFLAQSGTLESLQGIDRGLVLDLNPVVTTSVSGTPTTVDGTPTDPGWNYDASSPEFGGNVRWGLTSNLTLTGTVNPDFSQIEADAGQTDFNPQRSIFFPEKRPFFLEGSESFQTPNNLIYTRSVVDPVAAVKLTGKISGTEVGFLSAVDDKSLSATGLDSPVFNILRIKRNIGEESTIGIAYTDRVEGSDYNRVIGLDSRIVLGGNYDFQAQGGVTLDRKDGHTDDAYLWDVSLRRSGRRFGFNTNFTAYDDDLALGSGFVRRSGTVRIGGSTSLTFYGEEGALVEQYRPNLNLSYTWLYETFMHGGSVDDAIRFTYANNFVFRGGWRLGASVLIEEFYYPPTLYTDYFVELQTPTGTEYAPYVGTPALQNYLIGLRFSTPSSSRFAGSLSWYGGQDENFNEWASAYISFLTIDATWRPTDQLRIEGRLVSQRGYRPDDWSAERKVDIPRLKVEYQLTRSIFFRFVGQYQATNIDELHDQSRTEAPIYILNDEGALERAVGSTKNDLRFDALFSYEPSPGTVVFAGYGSSVTEDDSFHFDNLRRTSDGFFMKLSYLFRM